MEVKIKAKEFDGCQTVKDMSDQINPGIDGSTFKIVLNKAFTTGDVLGYDKFTSNLEEWGWQEIGREQAIMCVEEILKSIPKTFNNKIRYWKEVLKELKVMRL